MTRDNQNKLRNILRLWQRRPLGVDEEQRNVFGLLKKVGFKIYTVSEISEMCPQADEIILPATPVFTDNWDEYKPTSIIYLIIKKELALKMLTLGHFDENSFC